MEQEVEYKKAFATITNLEQQLESTSDAGLAKAQSEAHRDIEMQFDSIIKVMQERKDALLKQVDTTYEEAKKNNEGNLKQLRDKIDGCKKAMESGTTLYTVQPAVAISIWQGINVINHESNCPEIELQFSGAATKAIAEHGKVVVSVSTPTKLNSITAGVVSTLHMSKSSNASYFPIGIAFLDGHLYFCDNTNNVIQKVALQGGKGKVSKFAEISKPYGITFNQKLKTFFVTNYTRHTIYKVTTNGSVSVFAGTNGIMGSNDGKGTNASFSYPCGITSNPSTGDLFVCDTFNHVIRKISPEGEVTTLAGIKGKVGYVEGEGESAMFNSPIGVTFDESDQTIIVCDYANNVLRKIALNGIVSTLCEVERPRFVEVITKDSLVVSSFSNSIFLITLGQRITAELFAGSGETKEGKDGEAKESRMNKPEGLAFDGKGCLYVAECSTNRICMIGINNFNNKK